MATAQSDSEAKLVAVTVRGVSVTEEAGCFSANFFYLPVSVSHHRKHWRGSQNHRIPSPVPHRQHAKGRFRSTRPCEASAIVQETPLEGSQRWKSTAGTSEARATVSFSTPAGRRGAGSASRAVNTAAQVELASQPSASRAAVRDADWLARLSRCSNLR